MLWQQSPRKDTFMCLVNFFKTIWESQRSNEAMLFIQDWHVLVLTTQIHQFLSKQWMSPQLHRKPPFYMTLKTYQHTWILTELGGLLYPLQYYYGRRVVWFTVPVICPIWVKPFIMLQPYGRIESLISHQVLNDSHLMILLREGLDCIVFDILLCRKSFKKADTH